MSYEQVTLITAPPDLDLGLPEVIEVYEPPNLSKLPTEILDLIFENAVEPPQATQHSERPRECGSAQILNICLTCRRFYKIAGSHLYRLCVVNYLRKKEIAENSDPWKKKKNNYSVFVSPQDVKPEHRKKDYSASFVRSGSCVRALQIGSAESLFTYPHGSTRTHHRVTTLNSVLDRLIPAFTHLTSLTLERSSIDYALPLDEFFRSFHLVITKCLALDTISLKISYCEHESPISASLFSSTLACGQNPCFPYPTLKEISIIILHKTNYFPRNKTIRHWPLELLGRMLNFSSRSIKKVTFACTTTYPYAISVEKNKRVPLSYIYSHDMIPDYADFAVETKKWDMPGVSHLVLDMDRDSLKTFDRYIGVTLENIVNLEFNVRPKGEYRRWHRIIKKLKLGKFPALEDLTINSYTNASETGQILHYLDREGGLNSCDRLKSTDVMVCSDIPYIEDCEIFLHDVKRGYGPCLSSWSGICRPQDPRWKVVF
ncbi:hypothetical protein TWF506_003378 [Arthrobotrys conoides]|uniref:F-box domain-containing protein n=1 Tax=Arthrobotrys conoides TaxID=74498 RepID=A0AAN8NGI0_9PEZI